METKWERNFDVAGPGNYQINDLCFFHDIYVTGSFWETGKNPRCITAVYNKEGKLRWHTLYEQQQLKTSEGISIAGSREGIYILAHTVDINNSNNITLVKYDELGTIQWKEVIEQSRGGIASEMLFDYSGNIYLAGWTINDKELFNIFVAKYRPSGELVWSSKYSNPSLHFSHLKFDIIKPNRLVVGGILQNTQDFFFLRYDSLGQFSGLTQYENPNQENILADIKIDEEGNVYLTGTSLNKETGNNYLTVVYNNTNDLLWAKQFDGTTHSDDIPKAIAVDESSNVYVTGSSKNDKGKTEILTLKYDKAGNEIWTRTFSDKKTESAEPCMLCPGFIRYGKSVVRDFYIAGTVGNDALLLKYNTNGFHSWDKTYSAGKGKRSIPTAFSGNCFAVQAISEKGIETTIIKYGKAEQFGVARWD